MAETEGKQYGLILPNKSKCLKPLGIRKLNPLIDSDDELEKNEDESLNWVEASLKKSAGNSGQKSLQKRLLREALEEDASVFQYDEVYDEMQAKKNAQNEAKKKSVDRKPKYIETILKHAQKRRLESERRTERKVQKEREAEGLEFADKESFVTSSYLKKMEELKAAEQEAKLELLLEEKNDVMKHKNFGVFYSHLFKQRLGEVEVKKSKSDDETETQETLTIKKQKESQRPKNYRTQRDLSDSPERLVKKIKKEPHSESSTSDDDQDDKTETYRDRRNKYEEKQRKKLNERQTIKGKSELRSRSQERYKDRDNSYSKSGSNRHYSTSSKDKRDNVYNKKHRSRSRSQDRRRRSRSRSQDRRRRSRSRDRRHKSCSRSRSRSNQRDQKRRSRSRSQEHLKQKKYSSHSVTDTPRNVPSESHNNETSEGTKEQQHLGDKGEIKIKEEPLSPSHTNNEETLNSSETTPSEINASSVKVKKESELEQKESKLDRIRKLFAKRTVGEKFEQALQLYYVRKAERECRG